MRAPWRQEEVRDGEAEAHGGADHRQAARGGGAAGARPDGRAGVQRLGVSEQSFYRWRSEYGGLKIDQAKRLKELERENARLRKAVADLTPDKQILAEAARGNY